jgi:transcription antitermination factor NusG
MLFWCCCRFESRRERLAEAFLRQGGFEVYVPRIMERRVRNGRKSTVTVPLFLSYGFVEIRNGWHAARWSIGVAALIMSGDHPSDASRAVAEIRQRECNGLIVLPERGPQVGDPVRVSRGVFAGQSGLYAGMRGSERVLVLLQLFGSEQRVTLAKKDIEVVR